jgi:hypothetical protein
MGETEVSAAAGSRCDAAIRNNWSRFTEINYSI